MREEQGHGSAAVWLLKMIAREAVWAARRLSRTPGFVAVAVLTLAVAIAPSLIFRLVDKAVLPPLPYPRSQDLVAIWQRLGFGRMATSYPKIQYLSEKSRTTDYAAYTGGMFFLERGGDSIRLAAAAVTPGFFSVLGARPLLGRVFREDENRHVLGHPVIVLSHAFWQSHLGGRPEVVGEQLRLNGRTFLVVGVMPAGFREHWELWRGLSGSDGWVPAMMAPAGMHPSAKAWRDTPLAIEATGASIWLAVGRLRPGHSIAEARAEADLLGREVAALWPDSNEGVRQPFELIPLSEEAVDPRILHAVSLLEVAGGLILLLGALNLGHLFLARGLARAPALGLHNVLGAPRAALVWGAACEALIIGAAGAFAAVLLTRGALAALAIAEPTILTAPFGVTFDPSAWRVDWALGVAALALAAVSALIFGLAPAWRTAALDTSSFLRVGSGVKAGGLRQLRLTRPRGLLVAAETALALALAFPALLLVRTMGHLVQADLGFRPQQVATAELRLPADPDALPAAVGFVSETTRRLAQSPGIASASWVSCLPIECGFYTSAVKVAGEREGTMVASVHVVAPDAFRTLGIPLRSGRDFGPDDRPGTTPMVILSEQAARRLGSVGPGSRIEVPVIGREALEVAGIVGDVPYRDLAAEPMPAVYLPLAQRPQTEGVLVARGIASDTTAIVGPFRQAVASMDAHLEPLAVSALSARVEQSVARFRGAAWLLGVAAGLALFLSAVGVYGLLSSLVAQSRPEMAIRIALGAAPAVLARSLATATLRLALAGLVVGASLGSWGATYLRSYLYGVSPWDLKALSASVVAAIGLATLAALRPSYHASRADPMTTLRCE
jgi:putative ABC transport system permease protein